MAYQPIERRQEYRLPYSSKVIFSNGDQAITAYAANISRGGLFLLSLEPFPIDTTGYVMLMLSSHSQSVCVQGKVVHIVFDRQRAEVECGMGVQFSNLTESHKSLLNLHVLNERAAYLELLGLLRESPRPNFVAVQRCLEKLPHLQGLDSLALRYRVERVCTLFEPPVARNTDEFSEQPTLIINNPS